MDFEKIKAASQAYQADMLSLIHISEPLSLIHISEPTRP